MIRVTDRTLSSLDGPPRDRQALSRFLSLLVETDPGAIEMSEEMYGILSPLPEYPSYVLRLRGAEDAAKYPRIAEFVCQDVPAGADERVRAEAPWNGMGDAGVIKDCVKRAKVRVVGMDGALRGDYRQAFARLRELSAGGTPPYSSAGESAAQCRVELCPMNRFHCATALATEWAAGGAGGWVVTSFGGVGGFAPTEEVIMALRTCGLRGADRDYGFFPEMAGLFGRIARTRVRPNKPVIGGRIFHVESGVHVDGILKQPRCYEPFPPEAVGRTRRIVIGKQSGAASIRAKLSELGITPAEEDIPRILEAVRAKGTAMGGALTDREVAAAVKSLCARREK